MTTTTTTRDPETGYPMPPWLDQTLRGIALGARLVGASSALAANVLSNVDRLVTDALGDTSAVAADAQSLYTLLARRSVGLRAAWRASPRFARIVGDVLKIAAAYRVHALKAEWLTPEARARSLERLHEREAERFYRLCTELRGGLLKLGQFASSRVDLLPEPWVERLAGLQDRVPPIPFEAIAATIESELGGPPDALFRAFEREPIAAASLAQVHGAELADGTRVVVKVQVPGVARDVDTDLAAFKVLAPLLGELFPQLDLVSIADEIDRAIREELDFSDEAERAAAFAARFAEHPTVRVPRVHPQLTARRVLTLERVDGERLVPYLEACETRGAEGEADRDRLFATLIGSFCTQVLEHGAFHADPHPGNFLVLPGPRLAIFDFGCVVTYPPELRRAYAALAGAVLGGSGEQVAALLDQLGFRSRGDDPQALAKMADMFLDVFRAKGGLDLATLDPEAEMRRMLELVQANPIAHVPQHFVMLGRVFASLGGLVFRFRPKVDFFGLIAPALAAAFR
ncbi:MAG: AarF/UbiB family protein [bacterium]